MSLDEAIEQLRELNEPVPTPLRLPTEAEVSEVETKLKVKFHPDYRSFLTQASDVVYGAFEPATITSPGSSTDLEKMCEDAWDAGVPKNFLPICEDNGDYYCMNRKGAVRFVSNDGESSDSWPDLATWIEEVWIGESD